MFSLKMNLNLQASIFQTPFEELNPETLSNQVLKYAKTVMQLEKGLPPNSVVPILKDKVEGMRHKVNDTNIPVLLFHNTINTVFSQLTAFFEIWKKFKINII